MTIEPVTEEQEKEWKIISNIAIKYSEVEAISEEGMYQAIDNIAWHLAEDTILVKTGSISKDDWEKIVDNKSPQLDNIIKIVALGTGVHPVNLYNLVRVRASQYITEFVSKEK